MKKIIFMLLLGVALIIANTTFADNSEANGKKCCKCEKCEKADHKCCKENKCCSGKEKCKDAKSCSGEGKCSTEHEKKCGDSDNKDAKKSCH